MSHKTHQVARGSLLVQLESPYVFDHTTLELFQHITSLTSGSYGRDFVIYDFTNFETTYTELDKWMRAQGNGFSGSISDPTVFTMLVGTADVLYDMANLFEQDEFGNVTVGIFDTVESAISYSLEAQRIFAAW